MECNIELFLDLEWWQICFVALMIFLGFLFTNYIIKKINEARIEERYARLTQREGASQGTQYQDLGLISVPIEKNKPQTNRPKKQISIAFDKDETIQQDYRTQKEGMVSKANNAGALEEIKEVVEKTADTLPRTISIEKESTAAVVEEKNNPIRIASYQTLANIVLPISKILPKPEGTTSENLEPSVETTPQHIEEQIKQNSVVGMQHPKSSNNNLQIPEKPEESNLQKNVGNRKLINEASKQILQSPGTSPRTDESQSRKDNDMPSEKNITENKTSTIAHEYTAQSSATFLKPKKSVLSKEIYPQEKVSINNSEFLQSEISQAPVETRSQKTSNSSLIQRFSTVKATSTLEITPAEDSNKDGKHPSTTIGIVMLDVTEKVGHSLFHNRNDFVNNNEQEVTNVNISTSSPDYTEKDLRQSSPFSRTNLEAKCSETKNNPPARDVFLKITSVDTDPQTSKIKKKTRKTLSHKLGETSKTQYTRNWKSFWDLFLSHRRS